MQTCYTLSFQPTVTIKLKPVAKAREARASPPVLTLPAPPAQDHTGEMRASHLTNHLRGVPWISPQLRVPLPPPAGRAVLRTLLSPQILTLVLCCPDPPETAQNLATLIPSGECVCLQVYLVFLWNGHNLSNAASGGTFRFWPSLFCGHRWADTLKVIHSQNRTYALLVPMSGSARLDPRRFI